MPGDWYSLDDGPMSGAENMSRDEYIFGKVREHPEKIILRTYSFDPPCISIGYHQDPRSVLELPAVSGRGIDLVRRITGGRALMHRDEFTYCISGSSESEAFGKNLSETFVRIAGVLVDALKSLGVDASLSGGRREESAAGAASPCLASVSRYEITAGGRKIVGSAQRRWGGLFLQHGSILLGPGSRSIADFLPGSWKLEEYMTSISEETGSVPPYGEVRGALLGSFSRIMDADFREFSIPERDRKKIGREAAARSVFAD
jgi:lipoate-protein ligase A